MKKIKGLLRLVAFCMALALSLISFSGCLMWASAIEEAINRNEDAFELVGETTLTWTYNEEYALYEVNVSGLLQNVTDKAWNGVSLTLMLYDEEGNGIGSASDYIEYVAANGTWRFCAVASTKYIPSYAEFYKAYAYNSNYII